MNNLHRLMNCLTRRWQVLLFISIALVLFSIWNAETAPSRDEKFLPEANAHAPLPNLELRIDTRDRARALCRGMLTMVGIADYFEFFHRDLVGGRKRISEGPWGGSLSKNIHGKYTLTGKDAACGAAYTIAFNQVDSSSIELIFSFTAPSTPSSLGFDIAKLSGDFFTGALLESSPSSVNDAKAVPAQSLPRTRNKLLQDKNRIRLRGALCDLEVTDMSSRKTMYLADGRDLPWDRRKSLVIGVTREDIRAGNEYTFQYLIRAMPPTGDLRGQPAMNASNSSLQMNPWDFFSLPPKEEVKRRGVCRLTDESFIVGVPSGTAESILSREIYAMTSLRLPVTKKPRSSNCRGIFIERISDDRIPSESFEIEVSPDAIVIRGADERGCLYAVYALMARLRRESNDWLFDCGTIKDHPDLPVRGACLELLKPPFRDVELMKRYLDALSKSRANTVILLHLPTQIRSWLRKEDDGGWTKKQLMEITAYARWLHMDVWGGMGSSFQSRDFPEMNIRAGSNIYDPFDEKNYRFLFSLYEEIISTYRPTTFLISLDEIQGLSLYAASSGKSSADIYASTVKRIHEWLTLRKIRTALWGDMLLDHEIWEKKVGSAHSNCPRIGSGATHLALQSLPRDVFILDWHYGEHTSYASIEYFRKHGFLVAGTSWHNPKAAKALAASVVRFEGTGMFSSDWGFWATMSPASTTLFAPLCAWSSRCRTDTSESDIEALANSLRPAIYNETFSNQKTMDLAGAANRVIRTTEGAGFESMFGFGSFLDLQSLQTGPQYLGGILFKIPSLEKGHAPNAVVVSNARATGIAESPRSILVGGVKAAAVAFLHTAFFEEPSLLVKRLGQYIVEYADGSSESVDIFVNWNITDIRSSEGLRKNVWSFTRSPDVLLGAKTAWRGSSPGGIPLNLQLFIWQNPHPEKKIQRIVVSIRDEIKGTQIALVGLTFLE